MTRPFHNGCSRRLDQFDALAGSLDGGGKIAGPIGRVWDRASARATFASAAAAIPLNMPDTKPRRWILAKMFIASLFADSHSRKYPMARTHLSPEYLPLRVGGLLRKEFDISLQYHRHLQRHLHRDRGGWGRGRIDAVGGVDAAPPEVVGFRLQPRRDGNHFRDDLRRPTRSRSIQRLPCAHPDARGGGGIDWWPVDLALRCHGGPNGILHPARRRNG